MMKMDSYLGWKVDFANPPGAPAFCGPDSVSWRVFKNPIALGVGGVAVGTARAAHGQSAFAGDGGMARTTHLIASSLLLLAGTSLAHAQVVTTPVALSGGKALPSGSAKFAAFSVPVINDSGQVAFTAFMSGGGVDYTNDQALYVRSSSKLLLTARTGSPTARQSGVTYSMLGDVHVASAGRVVFTAATEDAAVHARVQCLHAPVHHFREAGVVRYFAHRDAGIGQQPLRAARRKDLDAKRGEFACEFDHAGLVRDADQGAADRDDIGWVVHGEQSVCTGGWSRARGAWRRFIACRSV